MAKMRAAAPVLKKLRCFGADAHGLAGIEFALSGLFLAVGLLNAVDVGYYIYRRMEVENAAHSGAEAALKSCAATNPNEQNPMLPATQYCPGLVTAVTSAIQSTSLGTSVALVSGYPAEGYYCVDASNALLYVSSVSSKPVNCSAAGNATATPADYLQVKVSTPYQPLFSGISVMSTLGISSITGTSWMRMG